MSLLTQTHISSELTGSTFLSTAPELTKEDKILSLAAGNNWQNPFVMSS